MTDCAEQVAVVYHCLVCGPIMRFDLPSGAHITYHKDVPHGYVISQFDEDSNPQ